MSPLSTRVDRAAPSLPVSDTEQVSAERTRYFRRLSALPPVPSHVPTMPAPALKFVDATRGVLFALSQIHNALSQHLSVSRDERLVAHLQRLLASAAKSMSALIASLDRLDAASQSSLPDGLVVRQVLETCHDSVRSFRRAVAAMHTKMSQLEQSVDPRFTRTLLLLLHGSLGELRHCAELMAPQAAHVASYLPEAKYAPVPPLASPSAPSEMSRTWTRGSYEVSEPGDVDALQTAASTPVSKRAGMAWSPAQVGGMPGVSPASSSRQGALSIATPVRGAKESDGHSAAWLGAPLSASSAKDALGARVQLVTARATEVFRELGDYVQARLQETADPVTHQSPSGSRAKRLRDVADACSGTMYVTEKLQATCEHASLAWTSGSQDHALLWSQANQFVRVRCVADRSRLSTSLPWCAPSQSPRRFRVT